MALPIIPLATLSRSLVPALTAIALATSALPALAQDGDQAPKPHHPTINHPAMMARLTVSGDGQAVAAPDMAQITVGVSTQAKTAAEAMSQNATRQQAVIDQLKAQGIEDRDIQTSGLNLSPMQDYSREGQPPLITGYMAQNSVSVRVRELQGLGAVLDSLVESGANEINGISFSRENMTEAEDAARIDAIASATHRAEVMAKAAGKSLGPIMSISDTEIAQGPQPVLMSMAREAKAADTPIQAGELSISARVTLVYALLPEDAAPQTQDAPANVPAPPAPAAEGGN